MQCYTSLLILVLFYEVVVPSSCTIVIGTYGCDCTVIYNCFRDIYAETTQNAPMPAEFALQFLFRDLTSDADIIGPYFLAGKTMDSRTLFPCVGLVLFESYNLRIRALIMDGASYNLSLVQYICDRSFGAKGSLAESSASFPNPITGDPVFVVICPSHLLKNCINAIFSSQDGGTKRLQLRTGPISWKTIEDLWNREVERNAKWSNSACSWYA